MTVLEVSLLFIMVVIICAWVIDSKEQKWWIDYYKNQANSNYGLYLKAYKQWCKSIYKRNKNQGGNKP